MRIINRIVMILSVGSFIYMETFNIVTSPIFLAVIMGLIGGSETVDRIFVRAGHETYLPQSLVSA